MSEQPGKVRRRPNFTAFLLTGGVVGLFAGVLLSVVGPIDVRYDAAVALGFVGLICACIGVLIAGVVAVLLDRRV